MIDLPNPIEKSSTLTPKRRANEKCPSSCIKTIIEISTRKENIYTSGWASGASVGVIGSNKIGASLLVKKIISEVSTNKNNANNKLLEYFSKNSISYLTKEDWKKIDQIEIESASENFTRNKLVDIESINNKLRV